MVIRRHIRATKCEHGVALFQGCYKCGFRDAVSKMESRISNLSSVLMLFKAEHKSGCKCELCVAAEQALSDNPHGIKARL